MPSAMYAVDAHIARNKAIIPVVSIITLILIVLSLYYMLLITYTTP